MTIKIYSSNEQHILYDAERLPQIDLMLFQPEYWREQGLLTEPTGGRGQAFFIQHPSGTEYLLRHYRRGGLVAKLSQDAYFFTGLEQSRPFQEFRLTRELYQAGLPVPQPLAARVVRCGLFYQGDLITARIPDARSFAGYLQKQNQTRQQVANGALWHGIGRMIADFHRQGLNHADLNANNILVDNHGKPWLIDFDRCRIMSDGNPKWQHDNLQRLQRSIRKLTGQTQLPAQWVDLEAGYSQPKP